MSKDYDMDVTLSLSVVIWPLRGGNFLLLFFICKVQNSFGELDSGELIFFLLLLIQAVTIYFFEDIER